MVKKESGKPEGNPVMVGGTSRRYSIEPVEPVTLSLFFMKAGQTGGAQQLALSIEVAPESPQGGTEVATWRMSLMIPIIAEKMVSKINRFLRSQVRKPSLRVISNTPTESAY